MPLRQMPCVEYHQTHVSERAGMEWFVHRAQIKTYTLPYQAPLYAAALCQRQLDPVINGRLQGFQRHGPRAQHDAMKLLQIKALA